MSSPSPLRAVATAIIAVLTLLYPFLVYLGLTRWNTRLLAVVLLGLFGLRLLLLRGEGRAILRNLLPGLIAATLICLLVLVLNDGGYFLYYPVFMNLGLLMAFAYSLSHPPPIIERFARLTEPDLPDVAVPYCRKVTVVWCVFFAVNGSIALITALFTPVKIWTLYNGFISYVLMGLLFAVEYAVRRTVKKKYRSHSSEEHQ